MLGQQHSSARAMMARLVLILAALAGVQRAAAQVTGQGFWSQCAPFTVNTGPQPTAKDVLLNNSVFSLAAAGSAARFGGWPAVAGSPGPRNSTLLALTDKAVGELVASLGQPADGSTTFQAPVSAATTGPADVIARIRALLVLLYREGSAVDVYGSAQTWVNGTSIPFGAAFNLVQTPLNSSNGYGGQPVVYLRSSDHGSTVQALLNPPFIVQGYVLGSGGRCALYRQVVYPIDTWPFEVPALAPAAQPQPVTQSLTQRQPALAGAAAALSTAVAGRRLGRF